jgi:pimeloyl-ACP methyl ester carboxylesterase
MERRMVHGVGNNWCRCSQAGGYDVEALDLPGLGDDSTPVKEVTLQSYIDRVVKVVSAQPEPVLLLGHSMGGVPISGAGETIPKQIKKLVYLTAFLPKDGDSVHSMIEVVSRFPEPYLAGAIRPAVDGAYEFPPDVERQMFYNTCPPNFVDRAVARLRSQAERPLADTLPLSPSRCGSIPKTYIVCAQDRCLPSGAQHWWCERAPEVKKRVINTDHSPFYSSPEDLAAIIAEEARVFIEPAMIQERN